MSRRVLRVVVQGLLAATLVHDTTTLRRRLATLRTLAERPAPLGDDQVVLAVQGAELDQSTVDSVLAYARDEQLSAVELVPSNLPTAQAIDLLRAIDPSTYRADRHALGHGVGHAMLVDRALLQASGVQLNGGPYTPSELVAASITLKQHASAGTDVVIAPRLRAASRSTPADLDAVACGPRVREAAAYQLGWLALLLANTALNRRWGLVTLAAWLFQPYAVFAGARHLRPADLAAYSRTRLTADPRRLVGALRAVGAKSGRRSDRVVALRPGYQTDLAGGLHRYFEPKRTACPWCGSSELRVRLRTTDLFQRKPGRFQLDQCGRCSHIFQNPRLNPAGLEFYYRDFYDGLGERQLDSLFHARGKCYRPRASMAAPFTEPGNWLDVGTGHGHFCNAAREVFPATVFHGLDLSAGVELAERRGWIERGYRGHFVDLAGKLAGKYDVVSMFHYLEHSLDPQRELEAAHRALRPGGHVMIEVPDPECGFARLLGRWWMPWLQPQHLHFVPLANLRQRLTELGFTVVAEQRAEPHDPIDLLCAAWMVWHNGSPPDDAPWHAAPPSWLRRTLRAATLSVGGPAIVAGALLDRLVKPIAHRAGLTNAYRVLARKTA